MDKFLSAYLCKDAKMREHLVTSIYKHLLANGIHIERKEVYLIEIHNRIFRFICDRNFETDIRGFSVTDFHSYRILSKEDFELIHFMSISENSLSINNVNYRQRIVDDVPIFDVEMPS